MSSTLSFRRIDYSLRPAKHAERRMLCEIFRRLRPFQPVEDYVYIGLGSVWFADFALFHRALGIKSMLSIEREKDHKERIDANKPFGNIVVDYRHSSLVLPELDWEKRAFIWLDYDDPLAPGMLLDTATVASRAISGSVLAISTQCQQAPEIQKAKNEPEGPSATKRFRTQFGRERVPDEMSEEDLYGWPFGTLSRKMISAQIETALAVRNLELPADRVVSFMPICEIEYEDGVKMSTLVGVLAEQRDQETVATAAFDQLDFLVGRNGPIRINVPILTVREIRYLERQLPRTSTPLDVGHIPTREADRFAEFYRYFPNFAVLEG